MVRTFSVFYQFLSMSTVAELSLGAILIALLTSASCSQSASPRKTHGRLVVKPDKLDFGVLSPPVSTESHVTVHNSSWGPITVHWSSSCECVSVEPVVTALEVGQSQSIRVCVGLERIVSGTIGVAITGKTPAGQEVASFVVLLAAAGPSGTASAPHNVPPF
jgi:hypothetical protein